MRTSSSTFSHTSKRGGGLSFRRRLTGLFVMVALIPSLLLGVLVAVLFNLVIESWFSRTVKQALDNAYDVSRSYIREHKANITADILAMRQDLRPKIQSILSYPHKEAKRGLYGELEVQTLLRDLQFSSIFDKNKTILAKINLLANKTPPSQHNNEDLPSLDSMLHNTVSWPLININQQQATMNAFIPLTWHNHKPDLLLSISRKLDERALQHWRATHKTVSRYRDLQTQRLAWQYGMTILYIAFVGLVIAVMIIIARLIAKRLSQPIIAMIEASSQIAEGNFDTKNLPQPQDFKTSHEAITSLMATFRTMAHRLSEQRDSLLQKNQYIEQRRYILETILSSISSGVIGCNRHGHVIMINRKFYDLFPNHALPDDRNTALTDFVPELSELFEKAKQNPQTPIQDQLQIKIPQGKLYLNVQYQPCLQEGDISHVWTVDDMTQSIKAKMSVVWQDIAQRIAHEIKNPLTPIRLSAERIAHKWQKNCPDNPEAITMYLETIIRQVDNMRLMVDEFSNFARMPAPVMSVCNLYTLLEQAVFSEQTRTDDVTITLSPTPTTQFYVKGDERLLYQLFINLLKNAIESIHRQKAHISQKGLIHINIMQISSEITVEIVDNGHGFPKNVAVNEFLLPYVTSHEHGTGLGLSIVQKIVHDHGGKLVLGNNTKQTGAVVHVILPCFDNKAEEKESQYK